MNQNRTFNLKFSDIRLCGIAVSNLNVSLILLNIVLSFATLPDNVNIFVIDMPMG